MGFFFYHGIDIDDHNTFIEDKLVQ
jgi:hypothetical protein